MEIINSITLSGKIEAPVDGTFLNPAPYLGLPENVSDGTDVSSIIMGE